MTKKKKAAKKKASTKKAAAKKTERREKPKAPTPKLPDLAKLEKSLETAAKCVQTATEDHDQAVAAHDELAIGLQNFEVEVESQITACEVAAQHLVVAEDQLRQRREFIDQAAQAVKDQGLKLDNLQGEEDTLSSEIGGLENGGIDALAQAAKDAATAHRHARARQIAIKGRRNQIQAELRSAKASLASSANIGTDEAEIRAVDRMEEDVETQDKRLELTRDLLGEKQDARDAAAKEAQGTHKDLEEWQTAHTEAQEAYREGADEVQRISDEEAMAAEAAAADEEARAEADELREALEEQ